MQTVGEDGVMNNDATPERVSIVDPESIFLLRAGKIVTLNSYSVSSERQYSCQEHPHSWGYLIDRSRLLHNWLKTLLGRREVDSNHENARNEPQALYHRAVNTYAHRLWISATNGTVDRIYGGSRTAGQCLMPREARQLDLKQSLKMLFQYIHTPLGLIHVVEDQRNISAEKRPVSSV